jgi:hypothetical protein
VKSDIEFAKCNAVPCIVRISFILHFACVYGRHRHGLLAARADLLAYRDMLVSVRDRVRTLIEAGKSIDQVVAATPTKDFDGKWGGGYVSSAAFVQMVFTSLTPRRP